MAEFVVVGLEMIHVDRQHREWCDNFHGRHNGVDSLGQFAAVGKPGQRIEVRHLVQSGVLFLELGLDGLDSAGDRQPDDQLFLVHGLGQEVVCACGQTLQSVQAIGSTRHHDDVGVRVPFCSSDPPAKLGALDIGHHPVGDDEPPILTIDKIQSDEPRSHQVRLVAKPGERPAKCRSECLLVVNHKYSHGGFVRADGFGWRVRFPLGECGRLLPRGMVEEH